MSIDPDASYWVIDIPPAWMIDEISTVDPDPRMVDSSMEAFDEGRTQEISEVISECEQPPYAQETLPIVQQREETLRNFREGFGDTFDPKFGKKP